MEPIIYYFKQFWIFVLGEDLNFVEACKNGDAVTILAFICVTVMVFGFFLVPIYRICTFKSVRGSNKWWRKNQ